MADDISDVMDASRELSEPSRGLSAWIDRLMGRWIEARLSVARVGTLRVGLPSGHEIVVGRSESVTARVCLKSRRSLLSGLSRGYLGVAESYLDGHIETDDLVSLFIYIVDNEAELTRTFPGLGRVGKTDHVFHARRRNTQEGSRRNIAAHYDLGNEFYRLWLDESLTYSSGIYRDASATLEEAQVLKYNRILDALSVGPGQSLLEIGCGWGSFAVAAANRGAAVTAITISQGQHVEATRRISALDLGDRARVLFQDYRDTVGAFDRLASIEMIEAVGEENWPVYFKTISDRLKPGGIAVIQAITIREDLFPDYRERPDYIQRYIFPGGMLPTVTAIREAAAREQLSFETVEVFGASYAATLADWRRRFEAAWPRIEALGFDDRFRRMWLYYLVYCEVGFSRGRVDVGLYRLTKPR